MAKLVRSEQTLHGRGKEFWFLAPHDELEQWSRGPGEIVGRPAHRIDGFERAAGLARYTADVTLPGMLHTAVLRSPHPRARVARLDVSRALAVKGVRAAIGPGELPELSRECNFEGAPIAAVCADTHTEARTALRAIDVEFEVLEPLLDPDEAVRRGQLIAPPRIKERGDIERGLADADVVVSSEFHTQPVLHNAFETHQAVAHWEGDCIVIHISTQFIWGIRNAVADKLRLPPDKVRVICQYMGGGFGAKNTPDDYTFIAIELARRTGKPVRCALTRNEEHVAAGHRNATVQRLTVGAKRAGTLTVLSGEFVNVAGWDGWLTSTEGPVQRQYACENVKTVTYGAQLNLPPMKAFRAPGYTEGTFGLESLLDELAAELDLDALELRRMNYSDVDTTEGSAFTAKHLLECYRRAQPYWDARHQVRAGSTETVKRGVGLASLIWHGAGGPPSYAWIRVSSDCRATVMTAMQDIGTGTTTAVAMIAAEELGIPLEKVSVVLGDSAYGPYASISGGSFTTASVGPAVRAAAADARRQIDDVVAQLGKPMEEALSVLGRAQILGTGSRGPNPDEMRVLTFGVEVAEVAVDIETGEIRVEQVAAILDIGRVINPLGAASQVEGGIIQAIGHTLFEQRLHDPVTGRVLTKTFDAYHVPTIADVPKIITEFIDEPDPHVSHLGAKGVGELPIVGTAAAIANAIRDATGACVRELPITREVVLRALQDSAI